jgi:hypothetical protein
MYHQADWLMKEAGSLEAIRKVEDMVGDHTRLITCMALWNGQDASVAVPEAMKAGVGLYGFTAPRTNDGLVPLDRIFERQVFELSGDERNIAVLARAYQGKSIHSLWHDGRFAEPKIPTPFRISLKGRGRGLQDTASITHETDSATVTIRSPYSKGRGVLVRETQKWPASVTLRFHKKEGEAVTSTRFRIANGTLGFRTSTDGKEAALGALEGGLDLGRGWGEEFLKDAEAPKDSPSIQQTTEILEIPIPAELTATNPEILAFEWE